MNHVMGREEITEMIGTPAGREGSTRIYGVLKELATRINTHYGGPTTDPVEIKGTTCAGQMREYCRQGRTLTEAQIARLISDLAETARVTNY